MPPLVLPSGRELTLDVTPGWGGFDVEIDGQTTEVDGTTFTLSLVEDRATLVGLGEPGTGFEPLRRRGLITDSPRVLARDARERLTAD
jgi:NAD+ kinase